MTVFLSELQQINPYLLKKKFSLKDLQLPFQGNSGIC